MQIEIPMRARLYLLALIGQDSGGLEDEKRMIATELLYKIELPQNELGLYETPIPQGGAYLHLDRIAQAPVLDVDLTAAEIRRAVALLTEWKNYRPGDDRFIRPLLKSFRNALEAGEDAPIPPPGPALAKRKSANGL